MEITRKSMLTGKTHVRDLGITASQVLAYTRGTLVQDAFPHLSPGDREFILSGITEEEWNEAFPPETEEDG